MEPITRKKGSKYKKQRISCCKLYKTSLGVQSKEFFEHTTLHGVKYIGAEGRPFFEKFMWFVCVVVAAITLICIILSVWAKFQTNPTITGLDTDFHEIKTTFPSITICQQNPSSPESIYDFLSQKFPDNPNISNSSEVVNYLQELSKVSLNTITEFFQIDQNFEFIDKEKNLRDFIFQLMIKCENVFEKCIWKTIIYSCCNVFFPVFTEIGFCYTFNSEHYEKIMPGINKTLPPFKVKFVKETDLKWSLKFKVKEEGITPIYILKYNEIAGIHIRPHHIWEHKVRKITFSAEQTWTTEATRELSIKQRGCVFDGEIPLEFSLDYSYATCSIQCRMKQCLKLCNCVPHFYPLIEGLEICTLQGLRCIADNLDAIKKIQNCGCGLACGNTVYDVEKLDEVAEDDDKLMMETKINYFEMYKREVMFGWVDLLVSFGGIAGSFMGFSLLSAVEIIYYFTVRPFCMLVRDSKGLARIVREEASKPPPDYDLSLVPYFISGPVAGNGIEEILKSYDEDESQVIQVKEKQKQDESITPPFGIEFIN
ncbi:sodium channel protein Nach [Aethina tumida]|uniref:sodium channel protein Nach n=1 Tax=Aethina tumida TaxID=116153 RepID=UPI00214798CB|nr:sodium channel protein Nach [Aethina tumida]